MVSKKDDTTSLLATCRAALKWVMELVITLVMMVLSLIIVAVTYLVTAFLAGIGIVLIGIVWIGIAILECWPMYKKSSNDPTDR